jgi:hypothetical protein
MSILEHNKRNQTQESSKQRQDQSRILATHIVEESRREQRRNSSKCVPHKTLTGDSRGRCLSITIRSVRVRALKHEENAKRDRRKTNNRSDPRDISVLCERIDEESDRQPDRAEHSSIESVLRDDIDVGIGLELVVLAHLKVMRHPAQECTDRERNVGETRYAFRPAPLLLEGDGDDGQEEEDDSPAEGDPESESEHDGFGNEHANGFDGRGFQHGFDVGCVDVVFGDVALIASGGTELLRALVESGTTAGFGKEDEDGD